MNKQLIQERVTYMESKNAIIYYSWIGNTHVIATEIQRLTGFDIIRIEEEKHREFGKIAGAAMGAFFGMKNKIKAMDFSLKDYDNIILGCQVWAGKTTPAINTFLKKADFTGKKVWILMTMADANPPKKAIDSVTRRIEKKGGKVAGVFSQTAKWDPKTNKPIELEEVKENIEEWVLKFGKR